MSNKVIGLLTKLLEVVESIDIYLENDIHLNGIQSENSYLTKKIEIKDNYLSLNKQERNELINILNMEFSGDNQMHIYLMSILLSCTHNNEIIYDIIDLVCQGSLDPYFSEVIEFQISAEIFRNNSLNDMYKLRRKIHCFNVLSFEKLFNVSNNFITYNNRNKNRIVIFTEQILSLQHAPSKIVLDECYSLQSGLNMEVLLIVCPIKMTIDDQTNWNEIKYQRYLEELNGNNEITMCLDEITYETKDLNNYFTIKYKDTIIKGKQVLFCEENSKLLQELVQIVYDFNPVFIYNMGCINPMADICKSFTTVVSGAMNYGYPVSEGQVLLYLAKTEDINLNQKNQNLTNEFNQVIVIDQLMFNIEKPNVVYKRADYGFSDESFIIAIIGNRLTIDITDEFIALMGRILDIDNKIVFLIIGEFPNCKKLFNDEKYKGRVINLGFQLKLVEMIGIADIYLNPPRSGGGTSALIALYAGVPVITLPGGDVAGNVGEAFICKDLKDIIDTIEKYIHDAAFYDRQKTIGINFTHRLADISVSTKEKISRIMKCIEKGE